MGIRDDTEDVLYYKLGIKTNRDVFVVQQKKVQLVKCLTIEISIAKKASFYCFVGDRFFVYFSGHGLS